MIKKLLAVIIISILTKFLYDYFATNYDSISTQNERPKIFTKEQLHKLCHEQNHLYLAILGMHINMMRNYRLFVCLFIAFNNNNNKKSGKIYDVSKGAKHYKKGGSYDFFIGIAMWFHYYLYEIKTLFIS